MNWLGKLCSGGVCGSKLNRDYFSLVLVVGIYAQPYGTFPRYKSNVFDILSKSYRVEITRITS